ncbi:LysM peptidoglycan-binding domain-containing protein [uncultured Microscilla sp.]|uniref:LysM peptidoglycan-binding domain-containing protein n=1 Tax=uncultured Microscilla sp. TaxID=432653 RepID=UPI0026217D90|nr:LysM peptidoglycan-binding domain-containing protein [uncultured Microscilla sp.]
MTKNLTLKAFFKKVLATFLLGFYCSIVHQTQATPIQSSFRIGDIRIELSYRARQQVNKEAQQIRASPYFLTKQVPLASLYLPLVNQELRPLKIPAAFKYLALVNNPLQDSIKFWANAHEMAPLLGLRVGAQLDESLNVVMTSHALAIYFRKKYQRNQHWVKTLLSYEMSSYQIRRFLRHHYSQHSKTLRLDKNTPMFLVNFLATWSVYSSALSKKKQYAVTLIKYDLVNNKTFNHIGKEFSLPAASVQHYNAWFRGRVIPNGRKYHVIIPMPTRSPSGNSHAITHTKRYAKASVMRYSPTSRATKPLANRQIKHRVSRGETLYSISRLYGVSIDKVKQWNGLHSNKLSAGQQLYMSVPRHLKIASQHTQLLANNYKKHHTRQYAKSTQTRPQHRLAGRKLTTYSPVPVNKNPAIFHTVQSGDNLYRISKKYNVSVTKLRTLNKMRNNTVFAGKKLLIRPAHAHGVASMTHLPVNTKPHGRVERAAPNSPHVPAVMYVAGIKLKITDYAQRLIQSEVNQLRSHPRFFQKKLERIQVYMPIIKKILRKENIPSDFRFLPILESSLIANAVSSSNAVGYWQFKEESALEVGIQIDENVDERLNIVTATNGATRYLNRNHLFFKNWMYTLLSYNLGFAGTQEYLEGLYVNYSPTKVKMMTIDGNTHWYIRRFLAHKLVFEQPLSRYIATPTRLKHFTLRNRSTLQQIARTKRVDLALLRKYNQWLKTWKTPNDKAYTVILPLQN